LLNHHALIHGMVVCFLEPALMRSISPDAHRFQPLYESKEKEGFFYVNATAHA
jgi:hypothetical protein